jgi:hypothetical protein
MPLVLIAQEESPITPQEAIASIGKSKVVVEMTVESTKNALTDRGIIYLDSEKEFTSEKNLGIAISSFAAEQLKAKGIDNPTEYYRGKRIRVSGVVMRFERLPYLPVLEADQIEVSEGE